ncbi:MAG: Wzz/FepE/Etk N-terminal domain-containing protein [Candidatus Paceibacterota bacterium]|jgi:capsular polysaccharide biosynthesis protein
MELKEIFKIIQKEWKLICGIVFALLILAVLVLATQKERYEVNFSLLISQSQTQKTSEFKYDTYYALEAKDKIGDYVVAFLKSPENVSAILEKAQFKYSKLRIYDLRTFFRPYKASAQSIGVIFYLKNPEFAKNITNGLLEIVNSNLEKTYIPKEDDTRFEIKSTNPLVSLQKTRTVLTLIIVLVVGSLFSILIALFKNYLSL